MHAAGGMLPAVLHHGMAVVDKVRDRYRAGNGVACGTAFALGMLVAAVVTPVA
jgi:hypothetical protein